MDEVEVVSCESGGVVRAGDVGFEDGRVLICGCTGAIGEGCRDWGDG